jgi:putative oxidoreductase
MVNLALLVLRLTFGSLLMGHGGQKLFGWFKGPGLQGTAGWMESMNMKPGRFWALLAGGAEFFGGLLTTLGLLHPIGPLATIGAMSMATVKAHWGKPIWVTQGGAELPLTNIAIASTLMATGPGDYSLDTALGIRLPRWLAIPGLVGVAASVAIGASGRNPIPLIQTWWQSTLRPQAQQVAQRAQQVTQQVTQQAQQAIRSPQTANGRTAAPSELATGGSGGATR